MAVVMLATHAGMDECKHSGMSAERHCKGCSNSLLSFTNSVCPSEKVSLFVTAVSARSLMNSSTAGSQKPGDNPYNQITDTTDHAGDDQSNQMICTTDHAWENTAYHQRQHHNLRQRFIHERQSGGDSSSSCLTISAAVTAAVKN